MRDEAIVGRVGDEPIRPVFPLRVTVFGVAAVLIPEADYRALTDLARDPDEGQRLSRLDKDPEVASFILQRLGRDDRDAIRAAAIEHFGAERVPSRSAISRFVIRARAKDSRRPALDRRVALPRN